MEESSPGVVLNVRCQREGAVRDDAEALDLGGEGYWESVDDDGRCWGALWFGEGGFGADYQGLGLIAVELQEVHAHPAPDVFQAGDEGGGRDGRGGFGGDVDLWVITVAVKVDPMVTEDCAQGEEVDDEEEWTQD